MEMKRRTLAKGAAWAAPVVVASAAVPAYAASRECGTNSFVAPAPTNENGSTTSWTVPAGVNVICFDVLGAAGGGYTAQAPGGAGAHLTGKLPVTPGDTLTLIVGSGGTVTNSGGYPGSGPATGGKGYGNGGDSVGTPLASNDGVLVRYGGSGGAGSAILLNGQPVVIAGGGGGTGAMSTAYQHPVGYKWNGVTITSGTQTHPLGTVASRQQAAGSAGGEIRSATRFYGRTSGPNAAVAGESYTMGGLASGGFNGQGGAAAFNNSTYDGSAATNTFDFTAGEAGSNSAGLAAANGGSARSQYSEHFFAGDPQYPGMLASYLKGHATGGGGGGGYGGGAAGGSLIVHGGFNQQVPPQNAQGESDASGRKIDGKLILGHILVVPMAGAAAGSYLAPQIGDGLMEQGTNHNSTAATRNHGSISFTY